MSTIRKLASGSALRTANLVATALVSMLIMPFVVHAMGDRMYGTWALVASIIGYYGTLQIGLEPAINRYMARALGAKDHEECNRVFNTALRLLSAVGAALLAVTGLLAFLAHWLAKNPSDAAVLWKLIVILGVYTALLFPTRVLQGTLEGQLRYDRTASVDFLSLVLRTTLLIVIVLRGYKIIALALVTVASGIPAIILYIYFISKELPFLRLDSKYWSPDTARKLFSFGIYSFAATIANTIRFRVDALVVASYVGLAAVTHYRIGSTLTQFFMGMMEALAGFFPAVFSRMEGAGNYEGLKRTYFFATKVTTCIASFVGFALIAWGKPFIHVWMGPAYQDAYPVLVVLTAGLIVALSQAASPQLLYGLAKHKYTALANSLEAIANLALSIILAKRYGMIGVALGTLIPMVLVKLFIQPVYVCRLANIPYGEYIQRFAKTVAAVVGALVIPLLLTLKFAAPSYKVLFPIGIVSAILYVVPLWLFEFSEAETSMLTRAMWPRFAVKTARE
jgi:O-antigen/teichoic acid export membrane protein